MSISLTRYLIEEKRAGRINPDLRLLIEVVARACKRISVAVGKGALGGVLGDAGGGKAINIQGEAQKKLDVLSNEILLEANAWGGHLAACASEEMEHCFLIPDAYPRGNYLLLFDPLDGSSNIDVNVSVGTIFSRLMYEANPMSLLIEQAGGASTNGHTRMLDIAPTQLHQRVPVFLGSKCEVEEATRYPVGHDARA